MNTKQLTLILTVAAATTLSTLNLNAAVSSTLSTPQGQIATSLAAIIASTSANIVKVEVGPNGAPLVAVTAVAVVGEQRGEIDAAIDGDGVTIAFIARYLIDALNNVDADRFTLDLNGPMAPGVLRPADGRDYTHVVMPVRTTS